MIPEGSEFLGSKFWRHPEGLSFQGLKSEFQGLSFGDIFSAGMSNA